MGGNTLNPLEFGYISARQFLHSVSSDLHTCEIAPLTVGRTVPGLHSGLRPVSRQRPSGQSLVMRTCWYDLVGDVFSPFLR